VVYLLQPVLVIGDKRDDFRRIDLAQWKERLIMPPEHIFLPVNNSTRKCGVRFTRSPKQAKRVLEAIWVPLMWCAAHQKHTAIRTFIN